MQRDRGSEKETETDRERESRGKERATFLVHIATPSKSTIGTYTTPSSYPEVTFCTTDAP